MDRLAEMITIAGRTRGGFSCLILLFLSGFMIVALDQAPPFIRLAAYAGLTFALGLFTWLVWQVHTGALVAPAA
ncbi:MAG: hypothetical protein JNK67_29505 [Alphaproteobacteria bacterium]|nr:hypothetical protein [Alphaproteobacteria bacterium]